MRIMLVDDSATFREATKHLLGRNENYKIIAEANDGEEAIELYDQHTPSIILMDIEMPVLDGIEATRIIKEKNKECKIIALSAHREKLYLHDAIAKGFSGFVYKNNMASELYDAIEKVNSGEFYFPD